MTVSLWLLDWAVRLRGNIFNTRENKSISLNAFPSLLHICYDKCLLRHSNYNGLSQSYLFFFWIEIKVTEWISFEKKLNVAFSYTLKMHSKGSQQSMGPSHLFFPLAVAISLVKKKKKWHHNNWIAPGKCYLPCTLESFPNRCSIQEANGFKEVM